MNWDAAVQGFSLSAALIIAIGAQNAFVLRQGLQRRYLFMTAILCALIDASLITAGVLGLGYLVQENPSLLFVSKVGGAAFLFYYGIRSFRSAFAPPHQLTPDKAAGKSQTRKSVLLMLLAFSFLNPHVYLDTVVLIGSIGSQYYGNDRFLFIGGASLASFLWFFGLTYGASFLGPLFRNPMAWRILDILIGLTMVSIGTSLLWDCRCYI